MTLSPSGAKPSAQRGTIDSPLKPWTWTSQRREDAMTKAIWDLLSPHDDADIAAAATRALLVGVHPSRRLLIADEPMHGYLPTALGGPDLILLDNADRVRAVIEHKRGGPSQVTAAVTMLAGAYFEDPIARSVV